MKLIVAGGRHYIPSEKEKNNFIKFCKENNVTQIVEGGATGVDTWAKNVGRQILKVLVTEFRAAWHLYGGAAGPKRNKEMAEYGDAVVLFSGGKGTASMRRIAIEYKKPILHDGKWEE